MINVAPPVTCDKCGRLIGKRAPHWAISRQIWCTRCMDKHNAYDYVVWWGTRAYVAAVKSGKSRHVGWTIEGEH